MGGTISNELLIMLYAIAMYLVQDMRPRAVHCMFVSCVCNRQAYIALAVHYGFLRSSNIGKS